MAADTKQRQAAQKFVEYWTDKGYEKGQSQPFWLSLLREVFGIAEPENSQIPHWLTYTTT